MRSMLLAHGTCLCTERLMPISEKHNFSIAWPHLPGGEGQNVSRFVGCCPTLLIVHLQWFESWFLKDNYVDVPTAMKLQIVGVIHEALTQLYLLSGLVVEAVEQQMRLSDQHLMAADTAAQRHCLGVVSSLAKTYASDECFPLLAVAHTYATVASVLGTRSVAELEADEQPWIMCMLCSARDRIVAACDGGFFEQTPRRRSSTLFAVISRLVGLHARVLLRAIDEQPGNTLLHERLSEGFIQYVDTVCSIMPFSTWPSRDNVYAYHARFLALIFRCEVFHILDPSDADRDENVASMMQEVWAMDEATARADQRMHHEIVALHRRATATLEHFLARRKLARGGGG